MVSIESHILIPKPIHIISLIKIILFEIDNVKPMSQTVIASYYLLYRLC